MPIGIFRKFLVLKSKLNSIELRDRIHLGVLLHVIRVGVDDKMNRLLTHFEEICRILGSNNKVSKRLE